MTIRFDHKLRKIAVAAQILVFVLFEFASSSLAQTRVGDDSPPNAFISAFDDARRYVDKRGADALGRLATESDWEPYFRAEFNGLKDQNLRDRFRPTLERCRSRLIDWNMERATTWCNELRFDFLAALASAIDDPTNAQRVGRLVYSAQKAVHRKYGGIARSRLYATDTFLPTIRFKEYFDRAELRRFSGDHVNVPKELDGSATFVHSPMVTITPKAGHSWLMLTQNSPVLPIENDRFTWKFSVLIVNDNCRLAFAHHSLLICDGDMELGQQPFGYGDCSHCVVVCNGTITMPKENFELDGRTVLFAAGDFTGPTDASKYRSIILAGGKNAAALTAGDPQKSYFREGVKENPFGIKFVALSDAGVKLKSGEGVVYLDELTKDSPLAKHGLEKGDWVKSFNGLPIKSAAEFRRQLRESLLWGTGLFEIKRGEQTFQRLVKFAEPPKK